MYSFLNNVFYCCDVTRGLGSLRNWLVSFNVNDDVALLDIGVDVVLGVKVDGRPIFLF